MSVMEMPVPIRQESVRVANPQMPSASVLIAAISEALRQSGYGQLRRLELQCDGDSFKITGRVSSYFLKQFAQATVMGVPGVRCVNNEIQVVGD